MQFAKLRARHEDGGELTARGRLVLQQFLELEDVPPELWGRALGEQPKVARSHVDACIDYLTKLGFTILPPATPAAALKPNTCRRLIEDDMKRMRPGHGMVYTTQFVVAALGSLDIAAREVKKLGGRIIVNGGVCLCERTA